MRRCAFLATATASLCLIAAATASAAQAATVCRRPVSPVTAVPVAGTPSDWTITSFDGTKIRAHWFPVAGASRRHPAPTLFMGPGWSLSGDTDVTGTANELLGGLDISALHAAGYNVLTWDPRGFGKSTGKAEVDSPDFEGRDVSKLIDWVATQPGVQLDRPGDPRMGMVGGSYGGGIQWVTAAEDCRVDAIAPTISWNSLVTSLGKADTYKAGWGNILSGLASTDGLDPHIPASAAAGNATGVVSAADQQWFAARGPGQLVKRIHIPTLIVQGTVDTLFTLDEGIVNYRLLKSVGTRVSMLWFCGGHGACLTNPGNPAIVQDATIAWMNRWLKRDRQINTGPAVDIIDQNGVRYAAASYPIPSSSSLTAQGSGTLPLLASGGAGPVVLPPVSVASPDPLATLVGPITPAKATNAVDVAIPSRARNVLVVGAPQLRFSYRGTTPAGPRPTRVFAQLVDDRTGLVLGNQITPIDVTLDGATHTLSVPLETVAQSVAPGDGLTLQLVATTVAYSPPRLGGTVTFGHIQVSLPVVKPSAVTNLGNGPAYRHFG